MSRDRFEELWYHMVWSEQPDNRHDDQSHEGHRWMLVEDFVRNINNHREKYYVPCWILCADESISRWYGLGGHWINCGLPQYVALDRKLDDGCEIQNLCDGVSGIMMRLRLVKSAKEMEIINASL